MAEVTALVNATRCAKDFLRYDSTATCSITDVAQLFACAFSWQMSRASQLRSLHCLSGIATFEAALRNCGQPLCRSSAHRCEPRLEHLNVKGIGTLMPMMTKISLMRFVVFFIKEMMQHCVQHLWSFFRESWMTRRLESCVFRALLIQNH